MRLHQPICSARVATIAAVIVSLSVSAFGQTGQSRLSTLTPAAAQGLAPQPGESVRRLSIDDAVRLALENNADLKADRLDPQIGDTRVAIAAGAQVVGAGSIVDRSGGHSDLSVPFHALLDIDLPIYEPDACPLCAKGLPVVKPGSRPVVA
jgi:hypothetical protein